MNLSKRGLFKSFYTVLLLTQAFFVHASPEEDFYGCIYDSGNSGLLCNSFIEAIREEEKRDTSQSDAEPKVLHDDLSHYSPKSFYYGNNHVIAAGVADYVHKHFAPRGISAYLAEKIHEADHEAISLLSEAVSSGIYETLKNMTFTYSECFTGLNPVSPYYLHKHETIPLLPGSGPNKERLQRKAQRINYLIRQSYGLGSTYSDRAYYDTLSVGNFFARYGGVKAEDYKELRNQFLDQKPYFETRKETWNELHKLARFIAYILTGNHYQRLKDQYLSALNHSQADSAKKFNDSVASYLGVVSIMTIKLLQRWLKHPEKVQSCYDYYCYGFISYAFWPFITAPKKVKSVTVSKPVLNEKLHNWFLERYRKHDASIILRDYQEHTENELWLKYKEEREDCGIE